MEDYDRKLPESFFSFAHKVNLKGKKGCYSWKYLFPDLCMNQITLILVIPTIYLLRHGTAGKPISTASKGSHPLTQGMIIGMPVGQNQPLAVYSIPIDTSLSPLLTTDIAIKSVV